jgi:site-specific DNA-methyltransferase (adenine-specific)
MDEIITGDSTKVMKNLDNDSIDLVYLDPPFFTQRNHSLIDKEGKNEYSFSDKWDNVDEYLSFIRAVLIECKRVLKATGSIFLHCDKTASHLLRAELDRIFGTQNFRNEIIWSYRRWSNSQKTLLNSHQNILFYSKTEKYFFNTIYTEYSPTTNLDQILQERVRGINGKSKYKVDNKGEIVIGKEKKGVPLTDVWEIPYLNPKAKERSGYPTQKPILLLNQILNVASKEGDAVLDPFCGSGTTCVSAKLLKRKFIGIDKSKEATRLARKRLEEMIVTDSNLLKKGKEEYINLDEKVIKLINAIDAFPVQRNSGIDGYLKTNIDNKPIPVRVQRDNESLKHTISKILHASADKKYPILIVIQTKVSIDEILSVENNLVVLKSNELIINETIAGKKALASLNPKPS